MDRESLPPVLTPRHSKSDYPQKDGQSLLDDGLKSTLKNRLVSLAALKPSTQKNSTMLLPSQLLPQMKRHAVLPPIKRASQADQKPLKSFNKKRDAYEFIKSTKMSAFDGFVYLKPTKLPIFHGTQFSVNMYDLEIIDYLHTEKDGGFITLSAHGVTYFDRNGHGEFTELNAWVREYNLFHKLQKIHFFGQYKTLKMYRAWKITILHSKIAKAKETISKSLFFCDQNICKAMIEISTILDSAQDSMTFFHIDSSRTYHLSSFIEENHSWLHKSIREAFFQLRDQIRVIVQNTALVSLREKGFVIPWNLEESKFEDVEKFVKLTFTQQGARRNECKRLQHFVKLTDYMLITTLRTIALKATCKTLQVLFNTCNDEQVKQILINANSQTDVDIDNLLQSKFSDILTSSLINGSASHFPHLVSGEASASRNNQFSEDILSIIAPKQTLDITPLFHARIVLEMQSFDCVYICKPDLPEFTKSIRDLFKKLLDASDEVNGISNTIGFLDSGSLPGGSTYTVKGLEESEYSGLIQFSSIIMDSNYFMESLGRIWATLDGSFKNIWKWVASLDTIRETWIKNTNFNVIESLQSSVGPLSVFLATINSKNSDGGIAYLLQERFEKELLIVDPLIQALELSNPPSTLIRLASTISCDSDETCQSPLIDFFNQHLKTFSDQLQSMQDIPDSITISNVLLDLQELKRVLIPNPTKCLKDVMMLLPDIARDKNELILGEIQTWTRLIRSAPSSVDTFVEYLVWIETINSLMTLVDLYELEISQLYKIIDQYKMKVDPTDVALFQTLNPNLRQLKDVLDIAIETRDENIQKKYNELVQMMSQVWVEVSEIRNKAQDSIILDTNSDPSEVIAVINLLTCQLEKMESTKNRYESWGNLFKNGGILKVSEEDVLEGRKDSEEGNHILYDARKYEEMLETKHEIELKKVMWSGIHEWTSLESEWAIVPFESLNVERMSEKITAFTKSVYNLEKGLPPNEVTTKLKAMVEVYRIMFPTIMDLKSSALKSRHWEKIQDITSKDFARDDKLTLSFLMDNSIFEFKSEIASISSQASSEYALEEMLTKVINVWNDTDMVVLPYKDSKDVFILSGIDDLQVLLDDSQITIATIKSSRHIGSIKNDLEKLDRQLSLFTVTLEAWVTCQRSWMYLESIFTAPDIQRQLPDEAKLFVQVDRSWKDIMRKTSRNPNALKAGTLPGLFEICQQNNAYLEQIQKCLEEYLESKRLLFPRFYFLSNEELLEILAQTKNPLAVQPHLSKCFDAIKSLEFSSSDPKTMEILSMISPEGERIAFSKGIKTRGNVETWLGAVEEGMILALKRHLKSAMEEYIDESRIEWVLKQPGQIVLAANQIMWTQSVQDCLESRSARLMLISLKEKWITNLSHLAALVRGDLSNIQRAIIGSLITIDVHNRDILQSLIDNHVINQSEFDWVKQLRYYYDASNESCFIKMSSSTYNYGFEYLGCSSRLVITSLTDRCYLTLIGALELNLGGSPMGPAGTGKTETVKDLAKALAKQCVVLNCSDGMDYKMMGKMFAGLAQSGAWCCFDEFNRIDIEVLSVVAQQLLSIKQAKDQRVSRFLFEGRDIRLVDTCAAFITMNPGYAGRSELPDNLKALFRPIAMMIPDYGLIAEIMLFSEGFESAKILSAKVVTLYKLCSEQLSQASHYDFGMRAVKSVLVMAGSVKRANVGLPEEVVVMRSLKNSNLPKFLEEDVPLFNGILSDLFPGLENSTNNPKILESQIRSVLRENGMDEIVPLINRIIQLWDTMKIRHGVMLVGPTGGAKTTCYKTLITAMNELSNKSSEFPKVKSWLLNPKCISMQELYGEFNKDTLEWKDGLMGMIFRAQVSESGNEEKWTICDGPVDALWIENMNTVLDDNKLLTLVNGERIKMNSSMHMLFEVQDLSVASPATVSRCGMVYMDSANMGWKPYQNKWLKSLPKHVSTELRTEINLYFDTYVNELLTFVRKYCSEYIPTVNINMVATLCKILSTFISKTKEIDFTKNHSELSPAFGNIFIFGCIWSFGGNLADGLHDSFDTFIRDLFIKYPIADVSIPSGNSNVFSYFYDFKRKSFSGWEDQVTAFKFSTELPFYQMIVSTTDTVKYSYLIDLFMTAGYPLLLSGQSGVGKSVIIQDAMKKLSATSKYLNVNINFSAKSSSLQTQLFIESKMEKKRKTMLGAPVNYTKVAVFIDDLNMPKPDTYGSQPPLELIRQLIDSEGFYDRESLTWKQVQDTIIIAACAPSGGGRSTISPRLTSHFSIFNVLLQSDVTLTYIFRSILDGFLKPFATEVRASSEAVVSTSIEIYRRMSSELLPTPAKSHYTFNLRDLSKVFQGLMQVKSSVIQTKVDLTKVVYHELSRIFHDRLINTEDRLYFNNILNTVVEKNFGTTLSKDTPLSDSIFGDFEKRGILLEDRVYAEILDSSSFATCLDEFQEEFNVTKNQDMNLIFFKDARKHLARLVRILRQPRGNALLVGVGGTGKQSLTKLACHILEIECYQIEMTKNYSDLEWKEDIREVYRIAGVQRKQVVFLLTDSQIKCESFLEDINSILNTGEVQNLFEQEEKEKIYGELRQFARDNGLPEDKDSVSNYFSAQIRLNLHIVFATSPIGETFRNRCRVFPSLVNCSTIDWFDEWPEEALLAVSRKYFEFIDVGSDELKEGLANACVSVHISVQNMSETFYSEMKRRFYTTPTSYLELIALYTTMLNEKRRDISKSSDTLKDGLKKLFETNETIAKIQIELELLQPVLKQKAQDVEALMMKITKDQEIADIVRRNVMEEEAVVRVKANETQQIAAEAQSDLDMALPALQAAYKALDALDKKDIAELKVFTKPPELVAMVLEAICILFKAKPDWDTSKKLMSDPQFMKKMAEYDKENIPDVIMKKLKKYIDTPNFNPDSVERVSKACKSMCMWVIAMELYSRVYKDVEPKRKILEHAQTVLAETQANLAEKTTQLQQVVQQLERLRFTYENSISEKQGLQDRASETGLRLIRAGKLTTALADEQIRWTESVAAFEAQLITLTGNIFLSAASVAYFGAFTAPYRQDLVKFWHSKCIEFSIPVSLTFSLSENMVDPAIIREWCIQNLPSDDLSVENAILATKTRKWPLMIDPQGQANRWIKSMEGSNLKCLKQNDPKLLRLLEGAVRLGQSVLIEDIGESLDPVLEPIMLKQTIRQGGRLLIKLGDSLIEYDRNFKLYITTKLSNPHYLPEVCIKATIINFTVTISGLEGQLLGDVVRLERPELEAQRNELIINISKDKKVLKEIEEKILRTLYNSKGNILDDEDLINTLNQSKTTSLAVKERVYLAEYTEKDINIAREKYIPVSTRGAICYFVMAGLSEIDPMYQFSLKYFKNLFSICIRDSIKSEDLGERIQILLKTCTFDIFSNIARGLFDQHKLIYAFLLSCDIMKESGEIIPDEFNYLIRGASGVVPQSTTPSIIWLNASIWAAVVAVSSSLPIFAGLQDDIRNYAAEWTEFMNDEEPLFSRIPWNGAEKITNFRKLILIKALREECLASSITEFVKFHLGVEFIDLPPLDLHRALKDTKATVPLMFILSPGSDPVLSLQKLASSKDINMIDRLTVISLGQGQGALAEIALRKAALKGEWIFLQNCHLAASWMSRLESLLKELFDLDSMSENFRLFLSSMPSSIFPTSILQDSVKITSEPPKGLRANLIKSFSEMPQGLYDDHPPQGIVFKKLAFGLIFFNAIIHERKKFGPLGWNIMYDWSQSDLDVSILNLRNILRDEKKDMPWDALKYLTGEISFGGRVTDEWDRRTLTTLLQKYYTPLILDDGYKFTSSGKYYAPEDGTLLSVKGFVDSLPFAESPEVFGMHENANIVYQIKEGKRIIKSVLDVQPRIVSNNGISSEILTNDKAQKLLQDLPDVYDIEEIVSGNNPNSITRDLFTKDQSGRMLDTLSTVLLQELVRYNKLLIVIRLSLNNLMSALKGSIVMSPDIECVFKSLSNNEVPLEWANASYPSLKPLLSWMINLIERVSVLRTWVNEGQPKAFWLSGFFFPQGFLTGLLQNHSRKYNIPIDTLSFSFEISEKEKLEDVSTTEDKLDGALIYGLFIEGARWDRKSKTIEDSLSMEMFSPMPMMRFLPSSSAMDGNGKKFACPLYKTSARAGTLTTTGHSTNFVLTTSLPTEKNPDTWISCGVALLCQLSD